MSAKPPALDTADEDVRILSQIQKDPIFFILLMWNLRPQPFKTEDVKKRAFQTPLSEWKAEWFVPFQKGKHITWQQYAILLAVGRAIRGEGKKRISIASGHGIGKSGVVSMIVLWYLYAFYGAQIACTAPSSDQIHGVLWKELAIWLGRMPEEVAAKYDHNSDFVRMKEAPKEWFASAKTARVDQPEALAGVHGDHVCVIADEASGVPSKVFEVMEGSLTGGDILVIMISNPTRLDGYFYDSHHRDAAAWQTFALSSKDSPIVEDGYIDRIRTRSGGEESDEYRVRVEGRFPREDAADRGGWAPVFLEADIRVLFDKDYSFRKPRMGIDPAGEGRDGTTFVVRDRFRAKLVVKEKISNPKSIVERGMALMDMFGIAAEDVYVDSFGEGGKSVQMFERMGCQVNAINVADDAEAGDEYQNLKAEAYYRAKTWLREGGELMGHFEDWTDLKRVRAKRTGSRQRIAIKNKEDMRKDGEPSPDVAEALMLTFTVADDFESASSDQRARYGAGAGNSISDLVG